MTEWQDISTAPIMVRILLFCPREPYDLAICIGKRWPEPNGFTRFPSGKKLKPTHWAHFPEPPK